MNSPIRIPNSTFRSRSRQCLFESLIKNCWLFWFPQLLPITLFHFISTTNRKSSNIISFLAPPFPHAVTASGLLIFSDVSTALLFWVESLSQPRKYWRHEATLMVIAILGAYLRYLVVTIVWYHAGVVLYIVELFCSEGLAIIALIRYTLIFFSCFLASKLLSLRQKSFLRGANEGK